jgi:hypothetical protein
VEYLNLICADAFVESAGGIFPIIWSENSLMEPTETDNHREASDQWLTDLLDRRQELSIQLAKLDVEIEIVRGSPERVRTKGVSDREF